MSCADVETIKPGNGTKTLFSFDFPYLFKSEIEVSFWNTTTKEWDVILNDGLLEDDSYWMGGSTAYPWEVTDANPTAVQFTVEPPPDKQAQVPGPNEEKVDNVRIRRNTSIADIRALFNPGSAIRSDDLNKNFEQLRYAIQESNCEGISDEVYNYLREYYWDRFNNTLYSADTWRSDDATIATTAALDQRFQDEVSETIESGETWVSDNDHIATTEALDNRFVDQLNDETIAGIKTFSSSPVVPTPTTGTQATNKAYVDDNYWNVDGETIDLAEQDAGSPAWDDNHVATAAAAAKRFDTIVQADQPTGTDWEVGKTWLQNDADKTLSIWNNGWVAVASGGSFTELTKVVYVDSVNGDDTLAGHRISNPKRTIKAAIEDINADPDGDGSIVLVAPGIYGEEFPIDIQKNDIAIVGQSIRNCIIHPAIPVADQAGYDVAVPEPNELNTMFRVNSGSYFYGLTLTGMKGAGTRGGNSLDTDATYGLPTNQGWNFAFYPGASIKKSPYIQNCTNFSDSRIDNVNFTPHVPGEGAAGDDTSDGFAGGGILIDGNTPASNSPLRSMVCDSYTHTALNGPGIFVTNNGYCQATSSYSLFGHYHLKTKNGGQANLAASTSDFGSHSLIADGRSTNAIFTATTTVTANDGDTSFTIGAPSAGSPWHGTATRPQDNMLVDIGGNTYPVLSAVANGAGWDVTISRPNPVNLQENLGLNGAVSSGGAVSFFLRSMIASSGHTMEYVGSGTDYCALPENGGVPDDTKQTIELNDGKIWAAITDHRGNFKVGDTFFVDQGTGVVTIAGEASDTVRKSSPTGSAILPAGTTAQRDAAPAAGYIRFNSTDSSFEGYDGSAWGAIGGGGGGATPAGVSGSIQINDGAGALGDVTDFIWDSANTELDVPGDISLDDGGTYTTTLQSITATADRFISFPDATGVVSLVSGVNGAVQFNNAGVSGGSALAVDATTKTFGYGTDGGAVTQATNKATGVTLNKPTGQITMNAAALAADTTVSFTLTNSSIAAGDILVMNHISGGTAGSYLLNAQSATGSASINVRNITAGSLSEAIVIAFAVIKSTTT